MLREEHDGAGMQQRGSPARNKGQSRTGRPSGAFRTGTNRRVPGHYRFSNGGPSALFRLHLHAILNTDARLSPARRTNEPYKVEYG